MKNIFDVTKGNNIFLFIISIPFIIVAFIFWALFAAFAFTSCLIGRRKAFNIIYKTKEWL